jgi:hypothetical protein
MSRRPLKGNGIMQEKLDNESELSEENEFKGNEMAAFIDEPKRSPIRRRNKLRAEDFQPKSKHINKKKLLRLKYEF